MVLEYVEDAFNTLLFSWDEDIPLQTILAANKFMEAILFPETTIKLKENLSNIDEFLNQLGE